jgi:hypothetical protein
LGASGEEGSAEGKGQESERTAAHVAAREEARSCAGAAVSFIDDEEEEFRRRIEAPESDVSREVRALGWHARPAGESYKIYGAWTKSFELPFIVLFIISIISFFCVSDLKGKF